MKKKNSFIRKEIRNNKFEIEELLEPKYVKMLIDNEIEVEILNNFENISNFIINVNVLNKKHDIQLLINDKYFLNTTTFFVDLCSNREYLGKLLDVLTPKIKDYLANPEKIVEYEIFFKFENKLIKKNTEDFLICEN